jgi:hypothetical protein
VLPAVLLPSPPASLAQQPDDNHDTGDMSDDGHQGITLLHVDPAIGAGAFNHFAPGAFYGVCADDASDCYHAVLREVLPQVLHALLQLGCTRCLIAHARTHSQDGYGFMKQGAFFGSPPAFSARRSVLNPKLHATAQRPAIPADGASPLLSFELCVLHSTCRKQACRSSSYNLQRARQRIVHGRPRQATP